jgi:hypothetical protein
MDDSEVLRKNLGLYPDPEYFMLTGNNRNKNFIDKKKEKTRQQNGKKGLFVEIYFDTEKKGFYMY